MRFWSGFRLSNEELLILSSGLLPKVGFSLHSLFFRYGGAPSEKLVTPPQKRYCYYL